MALAEAHAHETAPITLTETAITRLREAMAKEQLGEGCGVRLGVTSGGCSGFSYAMSFDAERRPNDVVTEQGGLTIVVDPESLQHLEGMTVDYVEGLHSSGFKFVNPNATRTCGCGTSFS